jgi:hypothetical protein
MPQHHESYLVRGGALVPGSKTIVAERAKAGVAPSYWDAQLTSSLDRERPHPERRTLSPQARIRRTPR